MNALLDLIRYEPFVAAKYCIVAMKRKLYDLFGYMTGTHNNQKNLQNDKKQTRKSLVNYGTEDPNCSIELID